MILSSLYLKKLNISNFFKYREDNKELLYHIFGQYIKCNYEVNAYLNVF